MFKKRFNCFVLSKREQANYKLGSFLASWRALKGFTQDDMASRMGVSRGTVSSIEKKPLGSTLENVIVYAINASIPAEELNFNLEAVARLLK